MAHLKPLFFPWEGEVPLLSWRKEMDGRSYLKHDGLVVFSWDLFPPPGNSGKSKLSIQIPEAKNVIKAGGDWDFGWRG